MIPHFGMPVTECGVRSRKHGGRSPALSRLDRQADAAYPARYAHLAAEPLRCPLAVEWLLVQARQPLSGLIAQKGALRETLFLSKRLCFSCLLYILEQHNPASVFSYLLDINNLCPAKCRNDTHDPAVDEAFAVDIRYSICFFKTKPKTPAKMASARLIAPMIRVSRQDRAPTRRDSLARSTSTRPENAKVPRR